MNVIVAGSRNFDDYALVKQHLQPLPISKILSGGARGADALGERYARENGYDLEIINANWGKDGRAAGILRNIEMSKISDIAVVFWDGQSRGSKHMISIMRTIKKPCFVVFDRNLADLT